MPHVRDESRKGVCIVSERGNYLSFTLAFVLTKIHARSLFVSDIKIMMVSIPPTKRELTRILVKVNARGKSKELPHPLRVATPPLEMAFAHGKVSDQPLQILTRR